MSCLRRSCLTFALSHWITYMYMYMYMYIDVHVHVHVYICTYRYCICPLHHASLENIKMAHAYPGTGRAAQRVVKECTTHVLSKHRACSCSHNRYICNCVDFWPALKNLSIRKVLHCAAAQFMLG